MAAVRFIARIRSFVRSDYRLPAAIVKRPSFNPASIYNLIADILIADTGSPDTATPLLQAIQPAGDGPAGNGFGGDGFGCGGVACDVLRLDQLHPQLSGNKLFKLIGYLQDFAEQQGAETLLSFGGPYSNHLHALAAAGHLCGIPVIAVVRGYEHLPLTPTLQDCQDLGARLIFADKKTYARRYDPVWQQQLADEHQALVIPEGGGGEPGERGCALLAPVCAGYDEIWLALGTGTTALGIARGLAGLSGGYSGQLVGVHAVADQGALQQSWQRQMPAGVRWRIIDDAHGGGFGKTSSELIELIRRWDARNLPLDPVYTGKLMWALEREISAADQAGTAVPRRLVIHSGGLQGRRGAPQLAEF